MSDQAKRDRDLTDLEAVTIAFVQRRQPCTPYQVRRSFENSTTTRFSSSAGSIYPLMRRLSDRGYIHSVDRESDGRNSIHYRVTAKGRRKVQRWIMRSGDNSLIGVYDPIRSRLLNLSLLPKPDQLRWLESKIALVEKQAKIIRRYEKQKFVGDERLYEIACYAMWQENALRLRWLRKALATIKDDEVAA